MVVCLGEMSFEEFDEECSDLVTGFNCKGDVFDMGCLEGVSVFHNYCLKKGLDLLGKG